MSRYVPELGQAAFGAPWAEFELSDIGEAAVDAALREIERVFWNRKQREISFRDEGDAEDWNALGSDVEWHAYWWGDDDSLEAARPNLAAGGLAIRWYKYPGRGMSAERDMTPDDWSKWLTATLEEVRRFDTDVLVAALSASRSTDGADTP